jgi:hypothetical protein
LSFIQRYELALAADANATDRRVRAWAAWCQVLFASSEFICVE